MVSFGSHLFFVYTHVLVYFISLFLFYKALLGTTGLATELDHYYLVFSIWSVGVAIVM